MFIRNRLISLSTANRENGTISAGNILHELQRKVPSHPVVIELNIEGELIYLRLWQIPSEALVYYTFFTHTKSK